MLMTKRVISLLDKLVDELKKHSSDKIYNQLMLEAMWLRQEIGKGNLKLPIPKVGELALAYHSAEGVFDKAPAIDDLVNETLDCLGI